MFEKSLFTKDDLNRSVFVLGKRLQVLLSLKKDSLLLAINYEEDGQQYELY